MLASYLLKVIDLVDNKDEEKRDSEAVDISLSLIMNIAGLLINNASDCIRWHQQRAFDMFRQHKATGNVEELKETCNILIRTYNETNHIVKAFPHDCSKRKSEMIATKNRLLISMASVLDKTSALTGTTYPTIFTSDHTRLNNLNMTREELESMKDRVTAPFKPVWLDK
jgi:hypothetical protein